MPSQSSRQFGRALLVMGAVLVLKVTVEVVTKYVDYLPPNFRSDFLSGREAYFYGPYRWAFYAHIASGPLSLILGLILLSETIRRRWPRWHRRVGRVQAVVVLLGVAPSGLAMAPAAAAGPIAATAFAMLALATGGAMALAWRAAMRRQFSRHRLWAQRCFVLLCAAVVIRLTGGMATVIGVSAPWFDSVNAWFCWLAPLGAFEILRRRRVLAERNKVAKWQPTGSLVVH